MISLKPVFIYLATFSVNNKNCKISQFFFKDTSN